MLLGTTSSGSGRTDIGMELVTSLGNEVPCDVTYS